MSEPISEPGQQPAPAMAGPGQALVGTVVDGRYRIDSILGEGGMGLVYKAVHTTLNKNLAVKVLRAEVSRDEEIVARFRQEAQSASAIGNQHIIDISDFGTLPDGATYFVMEFLGGQSLTDALEAGPFTLERTIDVTLQLCGALGAAHERGIVHRDMKPDNVQLIERGGTSDFVKVLDFGIAKVGGNNSKLTQAGKVFGTPHYMSPEQCAGTGVDNKTDIYAVGVILYEMVTGQVPFDADTLMGILTKHMYEEPVPPRELPPPQNVSAEMEQVVLRCLLKDPAVRYQSMEELASDLKKVQAGEVPDAVHMPRPAAPSPPTGGFATQGAMRPTAPSFSDSEIPGPPTSSKAPMLVGIAIAIAAIVGGVVMLGGGEGDPAPLAPAAAEQAAPTEPATADEETEAPPVAPAPAVSVVVTSVPLGAEVYRGGEFVGVTPYTMTRPDGDDRVELELRLDGYKSADAAVSAITGETLPIRLTKASKSTKPSKSRPRPRPKTEPSAPAPADEPPQKQPGKRRMQNDVLDPWG